MADLPQYQMPSIGYGGLAQQAISPVAQTNPLMSAASGIGQGVQLGLAAQQSAMQQRQLQIQQAQAMMQAKVQQAQILKEALGSAHQDFETLSKINPDAAVDFYHNKISPLQDEFWGQFGVHMDSTQIPPSHANADIMKQINQATDLAMTDPSKVPLAMNLLNHLNTQMNVGEMAKQKIEAASKTIGNISDFNKHQDDLEQQFAQEISATKARSGGYGQQDQNVNKGIHLRKMAEQYYDPKTGNYNVPQAQYTEMVMGLANMLSPTGTADEETRSKLESMTSKGKLNQAVQYLTGVPQTGNTQAVIKNLLDSIDRQGAVSQQLRDNYLSQIQPNQSLDPTRAQRQVEKGRGAAFTDYLPGGKNSAIQPHSQTIQRRGKDGKVYTYVLNPKTGKYE